MSAAHPLLSGTHGPITDESVFDDLPVIGEVPADLNGAFFRNGPNAHYPPQGRYHWFDGDGKRIKKDGVAPNGMRITRR